MPPSVRARGAASAIEALATSQRPRRPYAVVLAAAVSVAAVGGLARHVVLSPTRRTPTAALTYRLDDARADTEGRIEPDGADSRIAFSDGTSIELQAGAKAVVVGSDEHGARLALARGRVHLDVVHRPGARWVLQAGPFQIDVTGTAFSAEWSDADERLEVKMDHGSVEVTGPLSDGPIALRAGQELVVRERERETVIRDVDSSTPSEPVPNASAASEPSGPATVDAHGTMSARGRKGARSEARGGSTWSAQLAAGEFSTILREAEQRGMDRCVTESTSADLAAIADAARFERRDEIAREALLAQRRRFARTNAAHDAAFLLGRLDEAVGRAPAALHWYDAYLAEAPDGAYASEALGRKMTLTEKVSGDEAARPLARQYVERFPKGTYAADARVLVDTR
jgi:hypothetical protein